MANWQASLLMQTLSTGSVLVLQRQRVVAELRTTFAYHYTMVVLLTEALQLSHIAANGKRDRGEIPDQSQQAMMLHPPGALCLLSSGQIAGASVAVL